MAKITIAYVDAAEQMGGAEQILITLLEALPAQRFQPYLVCPREGELVRQARALEIPTLMEPLPHFASTSRIWNRRKVVDPLAILYDVVAVRRASRIVAKRLERQRVDLIHTNSLFAHLYGGLAAKRLQVPCVWHLHDAIESRRFMGLAGIVWNRLGNDLATFVVGSSNHSLQAFTRRDNAMTIYAGIGATYLPRNDWAGWRRELGLARDSLLVGYVGRLGWVKGLDLLAEAAKKTVVGDPRIHFVIVGAPLLGEETYWKAVLARVSELRVQDHWHVVGYHPDISHRLDDLDCVVLPSRRESLPRVLLEAGRAGKPVVATRVGGIAEVIEDGVTGLLVRPEDPKALADGLLALLSDSDRRHCMGEKARARIASAFSLQETVKQFVDLYEELYRNAARAVRSQQPLPVRTD